MTSASDHRFGKYTLLERITTGGMAEVYRAVSKGPRGFTRVMAIKKILPHFADSREFQRMFVDEATIAARLNHANIGQVYDFDIHNGVPYIAMEYVEGKDLRAILKACHERQRPIPYPVAVFLALEVAKGLFYVHSRREASRPLNIIHRDVSPQNIMLSYAGEVKLVDFGIARAVERETETVAGTIKGKYGYMSPEQVSGGTLDHRTDVFSLGIVLWEMLTLERLFAAPNQAQTINNVLRKPIVPPHELRPDIPEGLSPLIACALQRDPSHRYPTMLAFHEALSRFLFDTGSYPELEQVTSFLETLFPDDIQRLKQGEHLTFPDTDVDPEDPGITDPDATRVLTPDKGAAAREATAETAPTQPAAVTSPAKKNANPVLNGIMMVAVLALLGVFGWQFYQKMANKNSTMPAPELAQSQSLRGQKGPPTADATAATPIPEQADVVSQDISPADTGNSPDTDPMAQDSTSALATTATADASGDDAGVDATAEAELQQVTITLLTDPPDATIVIGKRSVKPGPIDLEVVPGATIDVRVSKAGFAVIEDRLLPLNGLEKTYELRAQAHLEIWVEPTDSIVKVDGRELTRSGKEGFYVREVGLGDELEVAVSRADYYKRTRTVTIEEKIEKVIIKLKPKTNAAALVERPSYGRVKIAARPYAQAYYGTEKQDWGRVSTPVKRQLPVGDHVIHLYHDGTDTWAVCKISIVEGMTKSCYHDFDPD